MKSSRTRMLGFFVFGSLVWNLYGGVASAADPSEMFLIRSTPKSPAAVVEAVKSYSEGKKWQYLGASKVKQGQITLIKICIPEIGQQIWPVGLHLSAMMPCGNLGVYQQDGKTQISALHPKYMHTIYPDSAVEKASANALPLMLQMLDEISK